MLVPRYWLSKQRLQLALANYPIYDPPHKTEERLLPIEKALDNFHYFMRVRHDRIHFFRTWLSDRFGVNTSFEKEGIEDTLNWVDAYVPIIMPYQNFSQTSVVFKGYARQWSGEYAGANAFFDLGAMLGETIIHHRPDLRWQLEWSLEDYPSVEKTLPRETMILLRSRERDVREAKREKYSGYRRPLLASAYGPLGYEPVYGMISTHFLIVSQRVAIDHAIRNLSVPGGLRTGNRDYLRAWIHRALIPPIRIQN